MELGPQILVYTAWLVVAIAGCGAVYISLAQRDFRRDREVLSDAAAAVARGVSQTLQSLRGRFERLTPMTHSEFLDQKAVGVRVTLYLAIPVLAFAIYQDRNDWLLVFLVYGLIYVAFGLPISVAHSYALRFLRARGLLISIAAGSFFGLVLASIVKVDGLVKPAMIWGAVYGLIVNVVNRWPPAPSLADVDRPRTLEEQAKADGL